MKWQVPTHDPQALALRSGSLDFNGKRQIYRPPPIILTGEKDGESQPQSFHIRVPVPDSRCRVKITVAFFPAAGATVTDELAGSATIWIAAYDEDQGGVSGSTGKTTPVTDVEGSKDTPTAFPKSAGLAGYSREFVTAADWLEAEIVISGVDSATVGWWAVQTRIQPDAVTLDWNEWDEIRRLFLPQRSE